MESAHTEKVHKDVPGWVQTSKGYRDISVWLGYEPAEPYEVKLTFVTSKMVTWKLSRDLLRTGTTTVCGDGDIHLIPEKKWIRIVLRPPQAAPVHILIAAEDTEKFLEETEELVASGDEAKSFNIDKILEDLLN